MPKAKEKEAHILIQTNNRMLVSRLMQPNVVTILPTQTCESAASKMADRNVGSLIVVSEENSLLGILTDRDIVRRLVARGKPVTTPVDDAMTREVLSINPLENVGEAARTMIEKNIKRLPVILDYKVVGIITLTDIIRHDMSFAKPILESRFKEE